MRKILHFFQHNIRHAKTFFNKNAPMRKCLLYSDSRMLFTPLSSPNSPTFGTKLPKCRRYGITILYRGAQKPAVELAAKSKYFSGSNHRTLEPLKHKSAATLSTIAATFCSIIIEMGL